MSDAPDVLSDRQVAEFLDLALSARFQFALVHDRVMLHAVNPNWQMWPPLRFLLDEIGLPRIEQYLRDNAAPLAAAA